MDSAARITLPGLAEALASVKALVSGCVATVSADDPGLFGPRSVSWKIFRSPAYSLSALSGLLLEALHPRAMAAIDQHSDYRRDAWRRAQRTADYVFTITFSGTGAALAAAGRVRSIHSRIRGTDPATGRAYSADDPELLLWIHCVNTEMALLGAETFGRGLTGEEAERFVVEQVKAAELVGLERAAIPSTRSEVQALIGRTPLLLSPPAREFWNLLLRARMPLTMRPFWVMHLAGAATLLPPEVKALYGFPRWIPSGRMNRALLRIVLRAMDLAYDFVSPIRAARRHLEKVGREAA